jgi:hypothetical protein
VPNFSTPRFGGYEPIFALDNDKAISATGNSSMTLNIDYSMVNMRVYTIWFTGSIQILQVVLNCA